MKASTIFVATLILLVSCTPSSLSSGEGLVKLTTTTEKSIEVVDAGGIDHYEYKATPQFTLDSRYTLKGETDWKTISSSSGASEIIGPFSQGYWLFSLRALAPGGFTMWEGEGEGYIASSSLSVIPITMRRVAGTGSVEIILQVSEYQSNMPLPLITVDEVSVSDITWEIKGAGTGTLNYKTTITDLSAGWHTVAIKITSSTEDMGDAVAVEIMPGAIAIINGTLTSGEWLKPHLKIDAPQPSRGEIILASTNQKIETDVMETGETHTYTYKVTSGRESSEIKWYVNGNLFATGTSFMFTPEANGTYEIAALSRYYAVSSLGGNWIEESTSASLTVLVHPDLSTLTWNDGTKVTQQRLPYETVLTFTSPQREGKIFDYWNVSGGFTGKKYSGDTLELSSPAYTFMAVWNEKPSIELKLTQGANSTYIFDSTSTKEFTVPLTGANIVVNSAATIREMRWFLDGIEIFWICDKGNNTYSISPENRKIGTHILTARIGESQWNITIQWEED